MAQKIPECPVDQGWTQYGKLVLSELERLSRETAKIQTGINKVHIDIATLKIKSGVWGAIAGSLAVIAGAIAKVIVK